MTAILIGKMNLPNYIFNTSDVQLDGTVIGISIKGYTCLNVDTGAWFVVKGDLTLESFALPIEATITGDVVVGDVGIAQPVAGATSLSPLYGAQEVAVPGTAEPLAASSTKVMSVVVFTKEGNTDDVYLGTAAVDKTSSKQMILRPGATVSIDAPLGYNFNLANWYVDAEVAGEGVEFVAMR